RPPVPRRPRGRRRRGRGGPVPHVRPDLGLPLPRRRARRRRPAEAARPGGQADRRPAGGRPRPRARRAGRGRRRRLRPPRRGRPADPGAGVRRRLLAVGRVRPAPAASAVAAAAAAAAPQERPGGGRRVAGRRPPFVDAERARHPGERVEVWFQDEARVGQQGTLTHVWAERGSRPEAVKQTEYDWVYLYASVNPLTGASSAVLAPTVNAAYMSEHLRMVGAAAGPGVHVVLVLDGAGWHVVKALK